MDKELLQLRIENALKHINFSIDQLENISIEEFENDSVLSRAISFSLVQIGEQLARLQEFLGKNHPEIEWSLAKSMRNFLVHDYIDVDLTRVYKTVKINLPPLKQQLEQLLD